MKKTKIRIKEMVKQELSRILREATLPKDPEAASKLAAMDVVDDLHSTPPHLRRKRLDPDDFSEEDVLGTTDPDLVSGDKNDPEFRLINRLLIRGEVDTMSPKEREELAGGDKAVLRLMNDILADPKFNNPDEVFDKFMATEPTPYDG
tara:strand:+ start:1009 stop:1452 length:444 start_codon:yes stop_codon:yes gene_type:complete